MTITFPAKLTIDECEKFTERLLSDGDSEELVLPIDADAPSFGGLASAAQSIMTWGRASPSRNLRIKGGIGQLESLVERTLTRPHKFCAAMMARSIKDTDNEEDLGPIIYSEAAKAIERQGVSPYGQQRGGLCWFVFVDHSTKGFDRNFYTNDDSLKPEVKQLPKIRSVIQAMIEKSMSVVGGGRKLSDGNIDLIGRLFFELFLNTHEHGSRDVNRADWLKPGLRLIYTNAVNFAPDGASESLRGAPPVDNYLSSLEIGDGERRRFIEISIIDSGLGLNRRWKTDHGDIVDHETSSIISEYEILKRCFSFRQTSSKSITKGNGLPVVMDRLTKLKGFMKVRSGRLSLFRNFVNNPYILDEDCDFFDWNSSKNARESTGSMTEVAGVLVTLLIPLEAK